MDVQGTDFKVIHNFGASATDGYSPVQGFVEGADHALYSTTLYGGKDCSANDNSNGCGTLYKITPNGAETTYTQIYAFSLMSRYRVKWSFRVFSMAWYSERAPKIKLWIRRDQRF